MACGLWPEYDAHVLAPIVLAAGASTRMGSPKAVLLDRDQRPFVVRIVRTLASAGLTRPTVVTAPATHDAIRDALAADPMTASARLIINRTPERGQLSSIWTAMDHVVTQGVEALVMTLVDVPFVSVDTVTAVVDAYRARRAPIVRPASGDRHGHPVIFDRSLFDELRRADLAAGAKSVVRAHEAEILNVFVDDEGAFRDVDTPDEYARAVKSQ